MTEILQTKQVRNLADIEAHFDACSLHYQEQHGSANRLLEYRLDLIKKGVQLRTTNVVLDIGCGPGDHLRALANHIKRGIGVDLSEGMIREAHRRMNGQPEQKRLSFFVDNGETLSRIRDESVDVALTVGVLEHVLNKESLAESTLRKLKPKGRWMILTLNGDYIWYRTLAPMMGISTKHLTTDRILTQSEIKTLLSDAGFVNISLEFWTFIPRGDISSHWGVFLTLLDRIGRGLRLVKLRGGLAVKAEKP